MKDRNRLSKKRVSRKWLRGFPGGPVAENPPANAGDAGSAPGWGAGIPQAVGQLSPPATTRACPLQLRPATAK